jgi:cysteinyl-tRNA synthetase
MSKSLGNILTLKEIFKDWHPEAIRLFLLSSHYRSPVDFSFDALSEVKSALDRFYATLEAIQEELKRLGSPQAPPFPSKGKVGTTRNRGKDGGGSPIEDAHQILESFQARFEEAMDDDFNTAQALGYFFDLQRHLNSLLDMSKKQRAEEILVMLKQGFEYFTRLGSTLGLFQEDPENYLNEQKKEGLRRLNLAEGEILRLIDERNLARKEKNWKRADEIRNDLLSKGIVLEDTPAETIWKIK